MKGRVGISFRLPPGAFHPTPVRCRDAPQLQEVMKVGPTLTITDRAFIDLTPQNTIDNSPGKNRRQRLYREALDLNKPGDVWSWRKAQGQVVKIKLEHEMYEGVPQERIAQVLKRS